MLVTSQNLKLFNPTVKTPTTVFCTLRTLILSPENNEFRVVCRTGSRINIVKGKGGFRVPHYTYLSLLTMSTSLLHSTYCSLRLEFLVLRKYYTSFIRRRKETSF